ncbi:hypothetical protein BJ165DRAFT_1492209 [Panaeolus papilionaceus]|nr:hypothetical protein BJ165DRAFT_1492209 [Panaeolus papilionaceus]
MRYSTVSKLAKQISEDGKLFERLSFKSKNIISTFKSSKKTPLALDAKDDKKESDKKSPDSTEGSKAEKKKSSSRPDRFNFIVEGIQEIGKFFASEAKHKADKAELDVAVGKLAQLNAEIEAHLALLDRSGEDVKGFTEKCKAIVSKLGKFSAVWKKLESDAALLSEFLTENGLAEATIVSRVVAESQVYDKIKHALDEYIVRPQ